MASIDFDADFVSLKPERNLNKAKTGDQSVDNEDFLAGIPTMTLASLASIDEKSYESQVEVQKQ